MSQERLCRCGHRATSELPYADKMPGQQNALPALSFLGTPPSSPHTNQSYQTPPVEQVTALVLVPEDVQLLSPNSSEQEAIPVPLPRVPTPGCPIGGQHCWTHYKADTARGLGAARLFQSSLEYKGRLALDPILLDHACLFGVLEAGVFKLTNTRMHQKIVLYHLGSSMTESAIFLQELTAMVGRLYWVAVMEELSAGNWCEWLWLVKG